MIPFPFNENRFVFFLFFFVVVVADHLLVGQLCTNHKSDRSLLSCLKVTQFSTSEIGDVPLYNSCPLPIQVMTAWTIAGEPRITGTCLGWWKLSFWLRLWSLVRFQVRATSCHITTSKSAWKSTTKCAEECGDRLVQSSGRWQTLVVAAGLGAGSQVQIDPGFRRSVKTLYPSLTAPSSPNLNPLDYFVWSYVENITNMTSHNTKASLITAIRQVFSSSHRRFWKRHAPSSGSVSRRWLRMKVATLNRCQLYYIIKLPELIFSIKVLK